MKKQLIFGVAVLFICVGLSGCNEQITNNDDEEFIRQAKSIINSLFPVTCYSLVYDSSKTTSYRLLLNSYELSSDYDSIRNYLIYAFERIDYAYESYLKYSSLGCDSISVKSGITKANSHLEYAQILLMDK